MGTIRDAIALSYDFDRSNAPDRVWAALEAFVAPLGYEHVSVMEIRDSLSTKAASSFLFFDGAREILDTYESRGYGPHNPLILRALQDLEPFFAHEFDASKATSREKRVLAFVRRALKVRDALLVPIRVDGRLEAIVIFAGRAPQTDTLIRSLLHVVAHGAFIRANELIGAPKRRPAGSLTAREVECLSWAAAGKTDTEIGAILKISARTARFHIENAKRKLGVATRIQAVAEALRMRAIAA